MTNGLTQRAINRPSRPESRFKTSSRYPCFDAPVGEAHRFTGEGVNAIPSGVSHLFWLGRPSAVIRRISAVIVDTLNLSAIWPRTHVRVETRKVIPPVAHGYTSPAVMLKVLILWVAATLTHRGPYGVLAGAPAVACLSVFGDCGCEQASATGCVFPREIAAVDECSATAFASAFPNDESASFGPASGGSEHGQTTECFACEVFGARVKYSLINHAVSFVRGAVSVSGWRSLLTGVSRVPNYPTHRMAVAS